MLQTEYKRDISHNYMILRPDKEIRADSFQVRMLMKNTISYLLESRIQVVDGETYLYYDITSRQALAYLYEKKLFGEEAVRMLIEGIVHVIEELEEYLIWPGQLVLTPEHIYVEAGGNRVFFCCLPGYQKDLREALLELLEYILPKLDHNSEGAVCLAYGIYKKLSNHSFKIEDIKQQLGQHFIENNTEENSHNYIKTNTAADPFYQDHYTKGDAEYYKDQNEYRIDSRNGRNSKTDWNNKSSIEGRDSRGSRDSRDSRGSRDCKDSRDRYASPAANHLFEREEGSESEDRQTDKKNGIFTSSFFKKIAAGSAAAALLILISIAGVNGYIPKMTKERSAALVISIIAVLMLAFRIYQSVRPDGEPGTATNTFNNPGIRQEVGQGGKVSGSSQSVRQARKGFKSPQLSRQTGGVFKSSQSVRHTGKGPRLLRPFRHTGKDFEPPSAFWQDDATDPEEYTMISRFPGYLYDSDTETEEKGEATSDLSPKSNVKAAFPHLVPDSSEASVDRNPPLPEIILDQDLLFIGKLYSAADKLLPYPQISRVHARIVKKGDAFQISDMNSRNGTKINGRLLEQGEEYSLSQGDQVSFADLTYVYQENM